MTGGLNIESKKVIYKQVYLPSILFASDVWASNLPNYLKSKLSTIQRKALLAITGCYPSVNDKKLLQLLDLLEINKEIECRAELKGKAPEEREEIRETYLASNAEQCRVPFDRRQINRTSRREVFWFATGHRPFRASHMNKEPEKRFRFCHTEEETSTNLMFQCSVISATTFDGADVNEYEREAQRITREIFKVS